MESKIKQKLVAQGLTEVITYSFVSEKLAKISGVEISNLPKINNPLSLDQEYMRGALWPSLVEVATKNQDYSDSLRIFEIASIYSKKNLDPRLHFSAAVKVGNGKSAFFDLKGLLWSMLREFNLDSLETKPKEVFFSEKGQGAEIKVNGKAIGQIGILDRKIASKLGHKTDLAIAEIDLTEIMGAFGRNISYQTLPKYPRAKRDISVVFSNELLVSDIIKVLAGVNNEFLTGYRVVDVFEGKPVSKKDSGFTGGLSENKKSVTISLEMGSNSRTLTEEEIESSVSLMVRALSKIGGEIRR
jgi:phenylalanyl-tRNA synthetase beta chain